MTKGTCSVEGCPTGAWQTGMCQKHYTRMRRTGTTELLRPTEAERFWSKVNKSGECWEWAGYRSESGYGQFSVTGRRMVGAHKWAYEEAHGKIASGLHIDHLCRNPPCVRPEHMEAVTPRVNTIRGISPAAENYYKTHCVRGHLFDRENTYMKYGKWRICRECRREEYLRKKERDAS